MTRAVCSKTAASRFLVSDLNEFIATVIRRCHDDGMVMPFIVSAAGVIKAIRKRPPRDRAGRDEGYGVNRPNCSRLWPAINNNTSMAKQMITTTKRIVISFCA
jgi:hypothetical protein